VCDLVVVVGAEQVHVASRKRVSSETGGDVLGPCAMRGPVLVGLPRREYLDDMVAPAQAECGLLDGNPRRGAVEVVNENT